MDVDAVRQEARRNTRGRFEQWAKNPTCDANTLSAVHNVRLDKAAKAVGLEVSFGQSPFAIARGNRFEAGLFWDDAPKLRAALERKGCLPENSVGFLDLRLKMNGGTRIRSVDHALEETEAWLRRIAAEPATAESIVAAPMIKILKGVILPEALLIIDTVTVTSTDDGRARVTVGEIKVFPDRGGHTDARQLASARAQAGVYEHAMRLAVDALGLADEIDIATHGFLVFTWPGSNSPSVRANEDLTYQAIRAERGFERLEELVLGVVRDEQRMAEHLDGRPDVPLFVKLPDWFKIPTPLGNYNPDWAIVRKQDGGRALYLVRETKGTDDLEKLQWESEGWKIKFGKAHFNALKVDFFFGHDPEILVELSPDYPAWKRASGEG